MGPGTREVHVLPEYTKQWLIRGCNTLPSCRPCPKASCCSVAWSASATQLQLARQVCFFIALEMTDQLMHS